MNSSKKRTLDTIYGVKVNPINKNEDVGDDFKYPKLLGNLSQPIAQSTKRLISKILIIDDER